MPVTTGPRILYFTGKHCAVCRAMSPVVEDVASRHADVEFVPVDVNEDTALAEEYTVRAVPTLVAELDGRVATRTIGARTPGQIERLFEETAAGREVRATMSPQDRALRLVGAVGVTAVGLVAAQPIALIAGGALFLVAFLDKLPLRRD